MRNGLNSQTLFFILGSLVILLHCYTIDLFPLPWFDEVHFAGISKNLADEGNLKSHFLRFTKGNENSLSYGPVFFAIQSIFIKFFGFNIYSVRLTTLLFGFANAIFVYILGCRITKSQFTSSLVSICFSLDLFYSTTLHEGRMETLITTLFLTALLVISSQSLKNYWRVSITSFLCVLSFSTSPRSFILIIPLIAYLMYNSPKYHLNMLGIFFSIFIVTYSLWVFLAFDSVSHWFYHYLGVIKGNKTAVHGYLVGNFYIPMSQYVLISTVLILMFVNRKVIKQPIVFLLLSVLLMFYALVHDWGNYSSLIIPLSYLLLLFLLVNTPGRMKKILFITPLLVFNLFYFSLKMSSSILEKEFRSIDLISLELAKVIPPNSNVIGDDMMIYIAEDNQWNYQVFNHYKDLETRELSLRTKFDYEYLLVSKQFQLRYKGEVDYFIEQGKLKLVKQLEFPVNPINSFLGKVHLSTMEQNGYSYFLYRRLVSIKDI